MTHIDQHICLPMLRSDVEAVLKLGQRGPRITDRGGHRAYARIKLAIMTRPAYTKKPGEKNSFWKAGIVFVVDSCGPLRAMMVAPRMHRRQPILPKKVSVSPRKMLDKIALKTSRL